MQKDLAIKLALVTAIALLVLIPLSMVRGKIAERNATRMEAVLDVARSWTGAQRITTPILVIPYEYSGMTRSSSGFISDTASTEQLETRYKLIVPGKVVVAGDISTDTRHKGIYKIPVYSGAIEVKGQFDAAHIRAQLAALTSDTQVRSLHQAYLSLLISDTRGIGDLPTFSWSGTDLTLQAGSGLPALRNGIHAPLPALHTLPTDQAEFAMTFSIRGMESLQLVPAANDASFSFRSSWLHPRFDGAYLPSSRTISDDGFTAHWNINQFSSGINEKIALCATGHCESLDTVSFGIGLAEPVDVYLQADRSTRYGLLFVGLSFIAFFIFETLRDMRIHPIQYTLVGLAISMFFLLLTSLGEHVSFGWAYLLAASCCISLLGYYVAHVLKGITGALLFMTMLVTLYGLLYVIVQAEDYALLMGAALVFAVLGAVMVVTRKIDWYQVGSNVVPQPPTS